MRTITFVCFCLVIAVKTIAQDSIFYQNVEWSPNGGKIVTETIKKTTTGILFNSYIIDVNTGAVERKIANTVFPVWSRDGKYIAYSKMTGVKNGSHIWMMNITTGDTTQITDTPSRNTGVSFSPDGKRVCFSSDREGRLNLYVSGTDGTGLQKITTDTFKYYNAVWSPKKDEIVYFRERGDGRDKVFVINLADKKEVKVTDDTLHNVYPSWMPNSREIMYSFSNPAMDGDTRQVAIINTNGGDKHIIPNTTGVFFARVSADGKKIAFTKGAWPQSNIYIVNIDGSNAQCLTCSVALHN